MRKIYFLYFLFMLNSLFAQKKDKLNPIVVYEKAWQEQNSDARLKIIKTIWLDDSTFEDPSASIKGAVALNNVINEFYKKFPDAVVTSGVKVVKDNYVSWDWKILDSKNKLIMSGRDFARLNGKGQVSKIIGFWNPEATLSESDILKNLETDNLKVVEKYYECLFKTRDFTAMATLIEQGAIYNQAEGLPYGGTYTGFEEWTKMYAKSAEFFEMQIEKDPVYFSDSSKNEIIIYFTLKCKSKKSGKTLSMPISEHLDLKNGKITAIRSFYFDTKQFAEFLKSKR
ncbi:nuclear transport factor 2 family protein [Flavobacterium circumlabens]|uniref:Nuclear transport factor 2 family protein n=1 Tax=Flavobacterium circumlabens TaxID=2133765 RepID=A0A4Y7U634_9FLAO|nr:nuclear transport factor 2 family protein [Flavobacterium circumlabens]TCN51087.1 SnoaL-like protein [Flavobacterium circumlabens]TEB41906.1 nuclear transport factor 2 family protein [Flavobacterium circumlabens]